MQGLQACTSTCHVPVCVVCVCMCMCDVHLCVVIYVWIVYCVTCMLHGICASYTASVGTACDVCGVR